MGHDFLQYPKSQDYELLWDLAQDYQVICLVDYRRDSGRQDVAKAWVQNGIWQIGARGIGYIWAESKEDFVNQCRARNVSWLVAECATAPQEVR